MINDNPKMSIIIPVYNRDELLPKTLDSIVSQSFTEWECIIIDDESDDDTYNVMELYQERDERFKIFKRPETLKKGANSCRNYGFLQAKGLFIKWFDSDDIMLPYHLEVSYNTLIKNKLDFVITDTLNFSHESGKILGKPYEFVKNKESITAKNFALNRIGWITDDFLGSRKIVENVRFNESITTDGDEYNFFVRLLSQPFTGVFIDEVLTYRRVHDNSLTNIHGEDTKYYLGKITNIKYQTAKDLVRYNDLDLIRWFLSGYMQFAFKLALINHSIPFKLSGFKLICRYYSITKGLAFILALITAKYLKKGFNIMKYARK
ncbi:glycosyltransferase family 2 protein [Yeosuana sp. AK3]